MAGVVRGRLSAVTYKLFSGFNNCKKGRLCFHTSAFLNVTGQEIKMPSLSPTMTDGTIVKWLKKEGDPIAPGDVLCEIQTDKAVMSFETEEEGVLAKILMTNESKDIKVGTTIALMVSEGEDWQNVDVPNSGKQDIPIKTTTIAEGNTPGTSVHMPSLSPTMSEGTIIKWHKKEGDTVSPGDVLCDIQTDKAVMSFETEEEGILAKILVPDGTPEVKVGTLIALMVSEGEDWKDVAVPSSSTPLPAPANKTEGAERDAGSKDPHHVQNYGPAVRGLLELYQLKPSKITASGRNDKILKSDVLSFVATNNLKPKPPKPVPLPGSKLIEEQTHEPKVPTTKRTVTQKYVDIELSSMRKTIAKRLTESKTNIPHAYGTFECEIDQVLSFRKQLKLSGIAVSVNDFVIKAVALALRKCPLVNCLYHNDQVVETDYVDVSVAVATESGLITPIVKSADVKGIDEISNEVKQLASKARQGKLQLHEFQGGTFTISNLGMFGISEFSAIINPPQCGILAVGGGRSVLDITGKPVTRMTATLSYDARAISEAAAADFLETIQLLLQSPASLLMNSIPQKKAARST